MKYLTIFKKIPQQELFKFAVDGAKHESWREFEEEEPGRIKAVLDGFAYIITTLLNTPPKNNLTLDFILELHKIATTEVQLPHSIRPGTIRACGVGYGLFLDHQDPDRLGNLSDSGIEELYPLYQANPLRFDFGKKNEQLSLQQFKHFFHIKPVVFYGYGDEKLFHISPKWFEGDLIQKIEETLLNYNEKIDCTEDKLRLIIKTIQQLEQIHPFADGNYRTFCILLLNYLLLLNDFSPVILYDPNRFDGYAINELIVECQEGFQCATQLQENTKNNMMFFKDKTFASNPCVAYAQNLIRAIESIEVNRSSPSYK